MNYTKIMRDLREDADLTQQQVADVLGTSQTMYARYERGANELPIHHLITLCDFYHVSTDYFLGLNQQHAQAGQANRKMLLSKDSAVLLNLFEEFLLYEQKRKKNSVSKHR